MGAPIATKQGGTGATSISAALDTAFGSTQGMFLYRDASIWKALGPGTAGQTLQSGGSGANPSWAPAALVDGCCSLTMPSSTSLLLSPKNGNTILVNGVPLQIPSGGITYNASGLTAGTGYYVYLNPAGALEPSTTAYAFDAAGRANKSSDATRRLIGWTRYGTGSTFLRVANYFNRTMQPVCDINPIGATSPTTASTSPVALANGNFFAWVDEAVIFELSGSQSSGAAQTVSVLMYADLATLGTPAQVCRGSINVASAAGQSMSSGHAAAGYVAAEGWHQAAIYGSVSTGAAATFNVEMTVLTRC